MDLFYNEHRLYNNLAWNKTSVRYYRLNRCRTHMDKFPPVLTQDTNTQISRFDADSMEGNEYDLTDFLK